MPTQRSTPPITPPALLKRMNKLIVCEGVETKEIADFLKEEGCSEIQGFLYYRPMCCDDFEKLIQQNFSA